MTITVKSHKENGIYVIMKIIRDLISVAAFQCCGYPIAPVRVYSINDKRNAEATYRRYVKKYCGGEM